MVVVVGQSQVARKVDFDSMALADRYGGHEVQELLEDLCGRLRWQVFGAEKH